MTLPAPLRIPGHLAAILLGVSLAATPAHGAQTGGTTPGTSSLVGASAAAAVPPPAGTSMGRSVVAALPSRSRLAVGDSLMVGASPLMRQRGFSVHARVGRQFSTAPGIVAAYGAGLARNVVIELGTNGTVSLTACRAVVRAAGPKRRVFLVTNRVPRSWQDTNNATLRACDASFAASRVRIIDWHAASAGRPDWFAADGIHTSARGRRAFVALIATAVDRHGR